PTEQAANNLLAEGVSQNSVFVTGNTVIDALLATLAIDESPALPIDTTKKLILMTAHRRENFGKPMEEVFSAVKEIAECREDIQFLYPVHPNPNVKDMAHHWLGSIEGVKLCEPLNYIEFVHAMNQSHIIMSDSGGVQEEAPAIGKPVVVLRENTERPEAVSAGAAVLVGTSKPAILEQVNRLIDDEAYYDAMRMEESPFGDGTAAKQIVSILEDSVG
ncbi:MAG: UDP-N-acetylglucosamine 2-epimerase (non-hydrolyzing), partial [Phycisphaerales bacterium]|nr:UDP-N-acetylglucosamine 2-epimerase (non-hydrolyzing) [Phycisphaerales bacterium]